MGGSWRTHPTTRRAARRPVLGALGLAALALLSSCGDDAATAGEGPVAPPPERTAAQDEALRAMVADVAEGRACRALRDRFLPLPEDHAGRPRDGRPVVEGRLWVNECAIERRGERLSVHLGGRGWQWVERDGAGPLGSRFTVRGTVPFEATVDLESAVDLRYDERDRRAAVLLTPRGAPRARVTPLGAVPVEPAGGWSSIVGGVGSLLETSPEARAAEVLEDGAAATLRRELRDGATLTFDLCTSQADATLGALGDGEPPPDPPYEDDRHVWLDNTRVRVHPGGLDLSGPYGDPGDALVVDLEVEAGPPIAVEAVCRAEAAMVASSVLAGGVPGPRRTAARAEARRGRAVELRVPADACEAPHLLVTPGDDAEAATTYRVRVRVEGARPEALADCAR